MAGNRNLVAGGGLASLIAAAVLIVTPTIQKEEGTRSIPYRDITGILTVCSGHTGTDVRVNTYYTKDDCAKLTDQDVTKAASGVLRYTPTLATHPKQLASAISFSYNIGVGAYSKSSVARDFNAGNLKQGCQDMLKYVYAGGKYNQGLANRRKQEYNICIGGL